MLDEQLALQEVREFSARVQTADGMWDPRSLYLENPAYKQLRALIQKQLPLIRDIAREVADEDLADRIDHGINYGTGYSAAIAGSNELLGILETADRRAAIFGAKGPRLSFSNMHPWVHGTTAQLWDDGYHREAVASAASAIFDVYLPGKVQMPKGTKPEAMIGKAFGGATPFLQIPGFATSGQDRTNAYEGAHHLGLACAKLVRNLGTHNVTAAGDENELVEELGMLSRLARIVDSSAAG